MVRFSCFHSHLHKPKKTVQVSAEAMQETLEDCSEKPILKDLSVKGGTTSLDLKMVEGTLSTGVTQVVSPSSVDRDWKSEEFKSKNGCESDVEIQLTGQMKKSLSLGSGLDWKGKSSGENLENELDEEVSFGYANNSESEMLSAEKDHGILMRDHETLNFDSIRANSNVADNKPGFSIGDSHQSEKEDCGKNFETWFSVKLAVDNNFVKHPAIANSSSLPNIGSLVGYTTIAYMLPRSRSSDDLNYVNSRRKDISVHGVQPRPREEERNCWLLYPDNGICENAADDNCDGNDYASSAKDWIVPLMEISNKGKSVMEDSSFYEWEGLPSKDFKIKRIEKWVMDLQHYRPLEDACEPSTSDHHQIDDPISDGLTPSRIDAKVTPGRDVAKKYLTSLSVSATTAHLANHGLAVIPFLCTFLSLKTLNLSGNAIVRITAGALPRGLHVLNLSKNNISVIEGLRDLTRLRVLDLSYNRIVRIGHGLASCSPLKELYLAGNKISEVEGLHRLLKLNVLDLRFNKISTARCLGQLAANYNSLQAISLEGNPAQKNVGDDQLKKYLQGLLPLLSYFNSQSIKAGVSKDATHQIDRGLRSESKKTARVSEKRSRKNRDAPRGRHGKAPPPSGTNSTAHAHQFHDHGGSKVVSFRNDAIRRIRSEGTIGVGAI